MRQVAFILLHRFSLVPVSRTVRPSKSADLRCEYLKDPMGVDAAQPRLSWIIQSKQRGQRQTAYQVLVAASPAVLQHDQGDHGTAARWPPTKPRRSPTPEAARLAPGLLLEGPSLGPRRPAQPVEQAGPLGNGPLAARAIGPPNGSRPI